MAVKLFLSVFDDGLISKWDHALPRTRQFVEHEGAPVTIELTPAQERLLHTAQAKARKVTGYEGKVRLR